MSKRIKPLFTWRSAIASKDGPKSSTTRHVLLTLSLHMNEKGGSCFPSLTTLEEETGLNRSTITRHLAIAEADGWVRREQRRRTTGAPASTVYEATIPAEVGADSTHPTPAEVGAQNTYIGAEGNEVGADSTQVGAQGTPNSTGNCPRNSTSPSSSLRSSEADAHESPSEPSVAEAPVPAVAEEAPPPDPAQGAEAEEDPPPESSSRPPWSTTAGEVWVEVFGGSAPFGRIGKALKPLIDKLGEDDVLPQWHRYLEAMVKDGRGAFATAEDFAARYGYYREHGVSLARGNGSRPRTTDRQEYAEGLQSVEEIRWKT